MNVETIPPWAAILIAVITFIRVVITQHRIATLRRVVQIQGEQINALQKENE